MPKYKSVCSLSKQALKKRFSSTNILSNPNRSTANFLNNSENKPVDVITEEIVPNEENNLTDNNYCFVSRIEQNKSSMNSSTENISNFLKDWTFRYNIQRNAISELVKFLRQNGHPNLPADSRTLFRTPTTRTVVQINPGTYCHIGIKRGLECFLEKQDESKIPSVLELDFNIDGLPLHRSSKSGFWLILGRIVTSNLNQNIFVIGVYSGFKKPDSFPEYLLQFVDEILEIQESFVFKNKTIEVRIRAFICDTPARAYVTGIKGHNAYFGCGKCVQEGTYNTGRMTFPETDSRLRTNESFRLKQNEDHHKYLSPIEQLDIDMVKQFPLDYLHCVCLGVMKRLLYMWTSGNINALLCKRDVDVINSRLEVAAMSQPKEFQRKIRKLSDLSDFKGTEFRTFILYTGPVVLKDVISLEKYNHFLLFHLGIVMLSEENFCKMFNRIAKDLLSTFVTKFSEIYGDHHIVYNVHSLVHLSEDCKLFGNLDNFSSFPFESYMYKVKRMLNKNNDSLAQLCNRIIEQYSLNTKNETKVNQNVPILKKKTQVHINGICENGFKEIVLNELTINSSEKNRYFLTQEKEIVSFEYTKYENDSVVLYGREILNKKDFYILPIASSHFNIYSSDGHKGETKCWSINSIYKKLFAIHHEENIIFFPLLHSHIN